MRERGNRAALLVTLGAMLVGCGASKEVGRGGLDVDAADGDADTDADGDGDGDGDGDAGGDADGDGDAGGDGDADGDDVVEPPPDEVGDGDADADPPHEALAGDSCDDAMGLELGAEIEGSTAGAADDYQDDCAGTSGPEVTYTFEPSAHGVLVAELEAMPDENDDRWDTVLYLRTDCGEGALTCNDDWDVDDDGDVNVGWSRVERCVQPGYQYHLVVDGYSPDQQGPYVLRTELTHCADGEVCIEGECRTPD